MTRVLLAAAGLVFLGAVAAAATSYTVHPDGSGDFPTLQAAINASAPGDTLLLGDGVFTGHGNRELSTTERHFESLSDNPTACRIDAGGLNFGEITDGEYASFSGIGFLNGNGFKAWYHNRLTFRNCRFESCSRIAEVASYLNGGRITLEGCEVQDCAGPRLLYASTLEMSGCSFLENTGQLIYCHDLDATNCQMVSNTHEDHLIMARGYGTWPGSVAMTGCDFDSNSAAACLRASYNLGAEITDCAFHGNRGDCIDIEAYWGAMVANCSFVANMGVDAADIRCYSGGIEFTELTVQNCVFAHRPDGNVLIDANEFYESLFVVTCTDVYDNAGGNWVGPLAPFENQNGNLAADPLFCGWPTGDITLWDVSPCLPENNACGVLMGAEGEGCFEPGWVPDPPMDALGLVAYPNPLGESTRLCFELATAGPVKVTVHDLTGRLITRLLSDPNRSAGETVIEWQAAGLPGGVYLTRVTTAAETRELKLIHLR